MPIPNIQLVKPYDEMALLVNATDEEYTPPTPLHFDQDLLTFQRPPIPFGRQVKSLLFTLTPSMTLLNHGSYGGCSKPVLQVRQAFSELLESEPNKYMEEYKPRVVRATRELAKYLNVSPRQIALVSNASTGTTSVLRTFPFPKDSTIISFDLQFPSVGLQLKHLCGHLNHHVVQTKAPYSRSSILEAFNRALEQSVNVSMIVVDHITSESGLIMPLREIIEICNSRSIPILVDGAHGIGQVPLDLNALRPDFYVSNLHKWMLAPKGAAFLFVREPEKYNVHAPVTSSGFGTGIPIAEFGYISTNDYAPFLSIPAALNFHTKMGGLELMKRNHDVCIQAARQLASAWNTSLLTDEVETMIGCICVIRLPLGLFDGINDKQHGLGVLQLLLRKQYSIDVKTVFVDHIPGVRISTQMYNEPADYYLLESAILDIMKRDAADFSL